MTGGSSPGTRSGSGSKVKHSSTNIFESTSDLRGLCIGLDIPDDKKNNAASESEHFIQSTEPMKGRKVIFCLDVNGDTALADNMMECAEPPVGMYMFIIMVLFN